MKLATIGAIVLDERNQDRDTAGEITALNSIRSG